ncbi:hypothetical protein CRUP_010891 [Coryphaenoides rupestris]|nr:hypothetical protein CRUP_010891 [Coryphaenoides rupestris]
MNGEDTRLTVTQAIGSGGLALLHFHYQLSEAHAACWDAALRGEQLFVHIPPGLLAEGSKEGSVALNPPPPQVVLCGIRDDKDPAVGKGWRKGEGGMKVAIIRTFHYMGFEVVKPGDPLVPARPDLLFMGYPLEASSSDEE